MTHILNCALIFLENESQFQYLVVSQVDSDINVHSEMSALQNGHLSIIITAKEEENENNTALMISH